MRVRSTLRPELNEDRSVPERTLRWIRCQDDRPCDFRTVTLDGVHAEGIYAIWYKGNPGRVVRIGKGNIAERLKQHRMDEEILAYASRKLYVTWAAVDRAERDGIERYLAEAYPPLVGERFPDVPPIRVNAPWS